MKILNGGYHKNQVICFDIWYDLLCSWPSIHKIPCKYSHVDQSYSNFEFSVAAILKIQNGGRYSSQITCLHFLYDSNNKKLSIHKISCFYDNLNNIATNRSTNWDSFHDLICELHGDKFTFDIIGISELFRCTGDMRISLPGYHKLISRLRDDGPRGGVGIFIKETLNYIIREDISFYQIICQSRLQICSDLIVICLTQE